MLIGSMSAPMALVTSVSSAIGADITDPAVARKVARIELARSIRAFAASTLANGDCLVRRGRLGRQQADQAMPIALQEMEISRPFWPTHRCAKPRPCSRTTLMKTAVSPPWTLRRHASW